MNIYFFLAIILIANNLLILFHLLIQLSEPFYIFLVKIKTIVIYDFLACLNSYLCKNILIMRLAKSEEAFFELFGGIIGVAGILSEQQCVINNFSRRNDTMEIGDIFTHIFTCNEYTPVEKIDELYAEFLDEFIKSDKRIKIQSWVLIAELGHCSRKLLIKLDSFWEYFIKESFLASPSVCEKVKQRIKSKY